MFQSDFSGHIVIRTPKDFEVLRKIYRHVEDIDLIVGAMAELPEGDSLVGPTFSCIIGEHI